MNPFDDPFDEQEHDLGRHSPELNCDSAVEIAASALRPRPRCNRDVIRSVHHRWEDSKEMRYPYPPG